MSPAPAPVQLAAPDAELWLWDCALAPAEAAGWLEALRVELPWRQDEIKLFGRTHPVPRMQSWHGEPGARYAYSGIALEPQPWTPTLSLARERVGRLVGAPFDAVLANLYRDGRDANGWHADDEPALGSRPLIASLSLGATRRFRLRHRAQAAPPITLELASGSLLVMAGDTQAHWQHSLPRTARPVGARINLTFRRLLPATRAVGINRGSATT